MGWHLVTVAALKLASLPAGAKPTHHSVGTFQIQDARNHVSQAIYLLDNRDETYQFRTGTEVLKVSCLQRQGSQFPTSGPGP